MYFFSFCSHIQLANKECKLCFRQRLIAEGLTGLQSVRNSSAIALLHSWVSIAVKALRKGRRIWRWPSKVVLRVLCVLSIL